MPGSPPACAAPAKPAMSACDELVGKPYSQVTISQMIAAVSALKTARITNTPRQPVTAFTVAHSITLALATLGFVHVPQRPVEAVIALSIAFVAAEIVRGRQGNAGLAAQAPWIVAFAFGLLHGFGFASGLTAMGLPQAELPLALLLFNIGVELGQLAFVLLVVLLERSFRQLEIRWPRWVRMLPGYAVGSLGAFWTIQRTMLLLAGR